MTQIEPGRKNRPRKRPADNDGHYRELFRHLPAGFALHEIILDKNEIPVDYRFLEVNPAFEKLTGLKASEIIGRTAREVLPGLEPAWIEKFGRVALEGTEERFEQLFGPLGRICGVTVFSPAPRRFATVFNDDTERR